MRLYLFLLPLLLLPITPAKAQVLESDSLALVALYQATGGANWSDNTSWLTGAVPEWFGVEVTADRVTQVDLNSNNLTGQLPGALGDLTALTVLDFHINALTGEIPAELGRLTNLTLLVFASNQLSDGLPPEIGNLSLLSTLRVRNNPSLSGPLPRSLTSLGMLDTFQFDSTNLCAPPDAAFQSWLQRIPNLLPGETCMSTATASPSDLLTTVVLQANYPNPFALQTKIRYGLPATSNVKLTVYNTLGREVQTLAEGLHRAGWHHINFVPKDLPGGTYFYRLSIGTEQVSGQMLLIK